MDDLLPDMSDDRDEDIGADVRLMVIHNRRICTCIYEFAQDETDLSAWIFDQCV